VAAIAAGQPIHRSPSAPPAAVLGVKVADKVSRPLDADVWRGAGSRGAPICACCSSIERNGILGRRRMPTPP
jgi:hypothetical protein